MTKRKLVIKCEPLDRPEPPPRPCPICKEITPAWELSLGIFCLKCGNLNASKGPYRRLPWDAGVVFEDHCTFEDANIALRHLEKEIDGCKRRNAAQCAGSAGRSSISGTALTG